MGAFTLENRALVDSTYNLDWISFYQDQNSVWGTIHQEWRERNIKSGSNQFEIKVPTLKCDSIFKIYGAPYFMKIDIEGQDLEVLKSLRTLRLNDRPYFVSIESTKTSWEDLLEEFNVLLDLGYNKFQVVGQSKNRFKITKWQDDNGKKRRFRHLLDSSGPFGPDLNENLWFDIETTMRKYRIIFIKYRLFGDSGFFRAAKIRNPFVRRVYSQILGIVGLIDWYDTHASK